MCGIVGVLHPGAVVSEAVVARMAQAVSHRGPDGFGIFVHDGVGLGHRRLAIIDPSAAGGQPMQSADGRFVITYNGEVYNFRELRTQLERLGHRFHSRTDTEVVLMAYRAWGPTCVERFNGMFAFAIWDRTEQTLLLARDRYGIKPLYYAIVGGVLLFGSEQKALLASGLLPARVDPAALVEYFTFQNFLSPRTLLEDVRLFPAGSWAVIDAPGSPDVRPRKYWDFAFCEPAARASEDEYVEELDRLFHQAVDRQLVSDVAVGAYLSGGMDSGSITAVAARTLPRLSTFTCGFDLDGATEQEMSFDERAAARLMAAAFDTDQHEAVLTARDMEAAMLPIAWHLEEPRAGQSYPNYFAARLARESVKVVLSGTGGDELFGGYPWRYVPLLGGSASEGLASYYRFWQRLLDDDLRAEVFRPIWPIVRDFSPRTAFDAVFPSIDAAADEASRVNAALTFEARSFLHGLLLVDDKLGMAHGLEIRVPFLDNDLVDFAMQLPAQLKVDLRRGETADVELRRGADDAGGTLLLNTAVHTRTTAGKRILRKMLARYVPDVVARREKQGFSGPDATWFRCASREWMLRTLFSPDSRLLHFLDERALRRLVAEHVDGTANRRLLIWSLLNVEQWLRLYV